MFRKRYAYDRQTDRQTELQASNLPLQPSFMPGAMPVGCRLCCGEPGFGAALKTSAALRTAIPAASE